tara:strand:+ start:1483 stop:1761 length:279 start_codon:yes stop_codon:yes gene_type:complete
MARETKPGCVDSRIDHQKPSIKNRCPTAAGIRYIGIMNAYLANTASADPEDRPQSSTGTLSAAGDGETPRKPGLACLSPPTLHSTAFHLITL